MRYEISSYELLKQMLAQPMPANVNACVEWPRPLNRFGYGRVRMNGKVVRVHRASYKLKKGPIPKGKLVCHKCDNPPCIRPEHLFLGTKLDNNRDCIAKARNTHGIKHPMAKLTESDIPVIRDLKAQGFTLSQIAQRFNVCASMIGYITRRKNWKHI